MAGVTPDSGFSLVEIVIAIVLMATVVVAILNAMSTKRQGIVGEPVGRAGPETAVVDPADRVNRAPKRCDYTIYVQAAVQTEGWPPATASVTHKYYVPGPQRRWRGSWVTGRRRHARLSRTRSDRPPRPAGDHSITSPDGKVRRNIEVVKSDV